MKTQTKPTPQIKQAKIQQVEPGLCNFQLYFQIQSVLDRSGDTLNCRIVDDTGIVEAYFNRYARKFDTGGVYLMTNLKCCLVNGSLRVEMSENTVVSKEPDIIGFKDKSNDMSKRVFQVKQEKTQPAKSQPVKKQAVQAPTKPTTEQSKPSIPELPRVTQALIPLTKQQAMEQLRIGREMYQNRKARYNKDKPKDHVEHKQTTHKQSQKQEKLHKKYQIKQENDHKDKNQNKNTPHKTQYKPKDQQKEQEKQKQKQKYVQKQKKQKYEERPREQGRLTKAKSLMYKQKKDDTKQHKQDNKFKKDDRAGTNKNGGNRRAHDKFGDYNYTAAEIEKKSNKYKLKQEPKQAKQAEVKNEESKIEPQPVGNGGVGGIVPNKQQKPVQVTLIKEQAGQQCNKDNDKKQNACININQVSNHLDNHVNLRVWITEKTKIYENSEQLDRYIADSSGAIWLRTLKINLQPKQVYEIDNLEVCKEQNRVYLKQTEISQARRLQLTLTFNLRDINNKQ